MLGGTIIITTYEVDDVKVVALWLVHAVENAKHDRHKLVLLPLRHLPYFLYLPLDGEDFLQRKGVAAFDSRRRDPDAFTHVDTVAATATAAVMVKVVFAVNLVGGQFMHRILRQVIIALLLFKAAVVLPRTHVNVELFRGRIATTHRSQRRLRIHHTCLRFNLRSCPRRALICSRVDRVDIVVGGVFDGFFDGVGANLVDHVASVVHEHEQKRGDPDTKRGKHEYGKGKHGEPRRVVALEAVVSHHVALCRDGYSAILVGGRHVQYFVAGEEVHRVTAHPWVGEEDGDQTISSRDRHRVFPVLEESFLEWNRSRYSSIPSFVSFSFFSHHLSSMACQRFAHGDNDGDEERDEDARESEERRGHKAHIEVGFDSDTRGRDEGHVEREAVEDGTQLLDAVGPYDCEEGRRASPQQTSGTAMYGEGVAREWSE